MSCATCSRSRAVRCPCLLSPACIKAAPALLSTVSVLRDAPCCISAPNFNAGYGWLLSATRRYCCAEREYGLWLGFLGVAVRACVRVGPPSTTGHGLPGSLQARAASLRMRSVSCKSLARASRSGRVPPYPAYPKPAEGRAAKPLLWVLLFFCWQTCLRNMWQEELLDMYVLATLQFIPVKQCCETYLHCLKRHCHYLLGAQVWMAWCLHGASAYGFQTGKPCWSMVGLARPLELLYLSPCTRRCVSRSLDEDVALCAQMSCGGTERRRPRTMQSCGWPASSTRRASCSHSLPPASVVTGQQEYTKNVAQMWLRVQAPRHAPTSLCSLPSLPKPVSLCAVH